FDLAFTNHNFQAEYDGKYKVIARWDEKPIFGVIAVLADSPARKLADLAGKRVAFPSMDAFVAYAVPMVALRTAGLRIQPVFANNQEGALAQLKARQVDAAAVNSRSLTRYAAEQGLEYREVFVSQAYADIPVIANNQLPKDKVEALQKAMLAMGSDPLAAAALVAAGFTGFAAAVDKDYDAQRRVYRLIAE
ncbi:MAG TPA: PhnD/SsuA/transferrin family substrate-binding protein, partial [Rhodocyclaceae bacterium]|nr:PhnD/SsuA/transferrin family substrate-binding protein [Rhodocyclaceae bacterium]